MNDSAKQREAVFAFWDALADCDAADIAGARTLFLSRLCALLDAQNAVWVGAVLMDTHRPDDPLNGWRPRSIHRLHNPARSQRLMARKTQAVEQGTPDIITRRRVALAGQFRVHRLVDLAPAGWFEGEFYKTYYLADGSRDSMWAGIPINDDAEIYVGLFRSLDHAPFSQDEREIFSFVLKGLRWFHRRQMLGEGLGVVSAPLTPTERRVLEGLLRGMTERDIAQANGQSAHTAHDHVKSIFRKYGVSSRSALMALWLGSPLDPAQGPDPVSSGPEL